jgi:hypothetical protein
MLDKIFDNLLVMKSMRLYKGCEAPSSKEKIQMRKQAGAELCQAQVKLGLAIIEIFFNFIKS